MPDKNPHAKHRERVKTDFLNNNLNASSPEHKLIELLLFFSIPRIDTNEIAHDLLNHFGSITNILDAKPEDLKKVKGIGENSAILINLIKIFCQIYSTKKVNPGYKPQSIDEVGDLLEQLHFGMTKEYFAVTTFDNKGAIIATDFITQGDLTSVGVSSRMVVENVIEKRGASAIISHNHPSGMAMPSNADIDLTIRVAKALAHIGVPLLDHVIVIDGDHVSLSQSARFRQLFEYRPE